MLQDLEAGKPLEVEALIGAVLEMGKMTDTPAPMIESVYALVKLLGHNAQATGRSRQSKLALRRRSAEGYVAAGLIGLPVGDLSVGHEHGSRVADHLTGIVSPVLGAADAKRRM